MRRSLGLLLALLAALAVGVFRLAPGPFTEGSVTDAQGNPVADARVRIKGTGALAVTDTLGNFRLPASPCTGRVTASKEGYLIAGRPGTQSPLRLSLLPLPTEDHADYEWVDPRPDPGQRHNC